MYIIAFFVILIVVFTWKVRPRRGHESGFEFVYVNQDGSARELSPDERVYLTQKFIGGDGGRPYIKRYYESRDGWGIRSGYIKRRHVPARIRILPVNPNYDTEVKKIAWDFKEFQRASGYIIVENPNGSFTCTPNPAISRKKRFELARNQLLEQQCRREELAKVV
jgi:hypothetical protein